MSEEKQVCLFVIPFFLVDGCLYDALARLPELTDPWADGERTSRTSDCAVLSHRRKGTRGL